MSPLPPAPAALRAATTALAQALDGPLLALDTSGEVAALALALPPGWPEASAVGELREANLLARALPSEAVMQALVDLLAHAQVRPGQLRALVVGLGPGSFTGLRVGLATLKGLAFGTGVPLYGASSLAMLAAGAGLGDVAVVRDARREDVYVGGYRVAAEGRTQAFLPDTRLPLADAAKALAEAQARAGTPAAPLRWAGEGAALLAEAAPAEASPPRAAHLLLQAEARLRRGEAEPLAALAPTYLREFTPVG